MADTCFSLTFLPSFTNYYYHHIHILLKSPIPILSPLNQLKIILHIKSVETFEIFPEIKTWEKKKRESNQSTVKWNSLSGSESDLRKSWKRTILKTHSTPIILLIVLIEISDCHDASDSDEKQALLLFAIEKLNESLIVNPNQHIAHYYLGNANVSLAFLEDDCIPAYQQAAIAYEKACNMQPENELYKRALKITKATEAMMQEAFEKVKNNRRLAQQARASTSAKPAVNEEKQKE